MKLSLHWFLRFSLDLKNSALNFVGYSHGDEENIYEAGSSSAYRYNSEFERSLPILPPFLIQFYQALQVTTKHNNT